MPASTKAELSSAKIVSFAKKDFLRGVLKGMVFGTAALGGAQAEYVKTLRNFLKDLGFNRDQVRVPFTDGTPVKAPPNIADNALILMVDIFPTGHIAAHNAFKGVTKDQIADATVVVIGCG